MKQIRKQLTYANVMSSLAVFLILGGATAIAAKKIGSNQLKANSVKTGKIVKEAVTTGKLKKNAVTEGKLADGAVTTRKIANDAVTGEKANESTFGTVPSAANANAVNGQTVNKIFKTMTEVSTNVPVATVGGFSVTANCNANDVDVTITPPNGPGTTLFAGGEVNSSNKTTFDYESNKPGEAIPISVDQLSEGGDATFGIASVDLTTNTGTVVSGVIGYDYDTFFNTPPNTCVVYGHLLAG